MRGLTLKPQGFWMVLLAMSGTPAFAAPVIDWDQKANIEQAAARIAVVQKRQGATKAFDLIVACYKTHGASSKYSKYFESCIAQDYIHTQALVAVYSRMPPDALKRVRAPSPKLLAAAMGQRVAGAFSKYAVPVAEANAFKKLLDKYGLPAFSKVVFPAKPAPAKDTAPETETPNDQQKKDKP